MNNIKVNFNKNPSTNLMTFENTVKLIKTISEIY